MPAKNHVAMLLWTLTVAMTWGDGATEQIAEDRVFFGGPPQNAADLKRLDERFAKLAPYVIRRTVAIQRGESFGSGVIVSRRGLVLTAAHVIVDHPGAIQLTTNEGKPLSGRLLGTDAQSDTAMLQITTPGRWPHAKLTRSTRIRVGAWCVATGHPITSEDRIDPSFRAGRVLGRMEDGIATDAVLTYGDSGGPLFDMNGHVLGIHSRIGPRVADSIHIPIEEFVERSEQLSGRKPAPRGGGSANDDNHKSSGRVRSFYHGSPIEIGRNHEQVRAVYASLISAANQGIVQIFEGERPVALGTIVDRDGHVLTKWSEIPDSPRCHLPEGRRVSAKMVAREPSFDVALLRLSLSTDAVPITWKETEADRPIGSLLATPLGSTAYPYAIGVISRGERKAPNASSAIAAQRRSRSTQISPQRFGFPAVLEHDTIVPRYLCGGPVVDVDGHVVGVNIARASRTTTYAIPAHIARDLVDRLLSTAKDR